VIGNALDGAAGNSGGAVVLDVRAAVERACPADDGWTVDAFPAGDPTWVSATPAVDEAPGQGWKLHVSADAGSAAEILARVLPVLADERVGFKVAASVAVVNLLNMGGGGVSQIGKFVTVYPPSDERAVTVADRLTEATADLVGPVVPSDRPVAPGSVVHYRYGSFAMLAHRTDYGEYQRMLRTPDGTLVVDRPGVGFRAPDWTVDPFAERRNGAAAASLILGGRFLRVACLHRSGSKSIYLGTDLESGGTYIIKSSGAYLRETLEREADVLGRLPPETTRPELVAVVEGEDDLALVLEDVRGETLAEAVDAAATAAELPPVLDWVRDLAAALGAIHAAGLVFSDLTPRNVLLVDGRPRIVDFELARPPTSERLHFGAGTVGYASPEQRDADGLSVTDDVYALGAVAYHALALGPLREPAAEVDLRARLRLMVPGIAPAVTEAVVRALAPRRRDRFQSAEEFAAALAPVGDLVESVPSWGEAPTSRLGVAAQAHAHELALALGDVLVAAARETEDGLVWPTGLAEFRGGVPYRDVNGGSAGIVLALAELAEKTGLPQFRETLAGGARELAFGPPEPHPLPGLYLGEAGIGAALLRAAAVLDDRALLQAAAARGVAIVKLQHESPDLFNGYAGQLVFQLGLWRQARDPEALERAVELGELLLGIAEIDRGSRAWRMPDGYDSLSGKLGYGYAHGAAGIADALLDLYGATGDDRLLSAAVEAGSFLTAGAEPIAGGRGVAWPLSPGEERAGPAWCTGAGGIARFLSRLGRLAEVPGRADLVTRSAWSVARVARWAAPIQCHGLLGNAELLVDITADDQDPAYLAEAWSLGELAETYLFEPGTTRPRVLDNLENADHGYLSGTAGALLAYLRLADPAGSDHVLRPLKGVAD
jgi:predicted Ser/Thr protein kinase